MSEVAEVPAEQMVRVVIVTGLAGAGKTTALKAFEDMGYEAVDNLPISLLPKLLTTKDVNPEHREQRPLAIGVDSRTRAFEADSFMRQIDRMSRRKDLNLTLLFLDCDSATLTQRFSETRRRHPLAVDRPVQDGISREREIMGRVRARADNVIDTTGLTVHDLKRALRTAFDLNVDQTLTITAMSFGFSRGVPRDSDLVFDLRFLANPNYVPELKPLTGRDERVASYVSNDPNFQPFFDRMSDMLLYLLPLYRKEGKSYLTIACGCTGGRHRSVFVAELLGRVLKHNGYSVNIVHRDAHHQQQ